jgi:hypothetical protein
LGGKGASSQSIIYNIQRQYRRIVKNINALISDVLLNDSKIRTQALVGVCKSVATGNNNKTAK